jgi:3-deoxy-D-manno-octulosonic-acid transferase
MIIIYRFFINLILVISPLIIIFRFFKKKEDPIRFREKLGFFSKKKKSGKLIWFHGASVGELQSIIPIIEKLNKDNKVKQILVTSNTLSSSKVVDQYKFKKVIHQFFPIDSKFLSNKFLDYWNPSASFFIDSEIWPNTILNLYKKNIPIVLLNARITKKTFKKWKLISFFSKNIFNKFNLCLPSTFETKKYLNLLGAKNIKLIGNLKYSQSENKSQKMNNELNKFISKKKVWCASSTHPSEEVFCGLVHKSLKKKYKNLLTIIIPRHINRISEIKSDLNKMNLKIHTHEPQKKIDDNIDIYLVNSYGQTKSFYSKCKNIFLGGSILNRGGQNPLEATRYGCNILHGPNISNFNEIYNNLKKMNISSQVYNKRMMINKLEKFFKSKKSSKKIQAKLKYTGLKILNSTYKEIRFIIR